MAEIINAKGLECPQPVIMAKKALEKHENIIIMVDNKTAVENLKRLGITMGCTLNIEEKPGGIFNIHMSRTAGKSLLKEAVKPGVTENPSNGPLVVVISSNIMGRGNDELGSVLIRSFLHTLLDLDPMPDTIIFYNTGVLLAKKDSEVADDLKQLQEKGAAILLCGTCTNYFKISDQIGAGTVSNMYDIAGAMARADKIIMP